MKDLWLKDGKKDAEIYIVKFEKIGNFEFQPFEGITSYIKDVEEDNLESEKFNLDTEENINVNNMRDSISPIKDVTKPMINDMDLSVKSDEEKEFNLDKNSSDYLQNFLIKTIRDLAKEQLENK